MAKALVLLSGGLDSMLAARVLMEQSIEVTGLSFKSYFFNTAKAKKAAGELGIKLIEVDFSDEHLEMVKNPAHGYGKNMNP
ncbi:MAG: 7-cyano-7-deazaguanine synthase, partial [Patescibacteria group bacterium]|nr:7-cyano-7-deazaguanine synthase [Patescibacteria group bacterium]